MRACERACARACVCVCVCVLQVQIAALMQLQGAGADPEQLERMQSMLSQKNAEIEALVTKVRRLESDQV